MAARNEVTLTWIPAHSAIYGNTLADNIAKFAADEIVLGPEPIIAINRSLGKKTNDQWLQKETESAWRCTQLCDTKCFLKEASHKISNQLLKMTKHESQIITGIITGHCKLNAHLAKLRIRNDPDCDLCGRENETAKHLSCECSALKEIRKSIYAREVIPPQEVCVEALHKIAHFYKTSCEKCPRLINVFK